MIQSQQVERWDPTVAPLVSIILVNYNGQRYLEECLSSLEQLTFPREQTEVILVDNASTDGSISFVRQRFPWVRLIESRKNLGFAAGNNLGIRQANGRFIALLNNDTTVDPHWLTALVEEMAAGSRVGGTTSKILFAREPGRINNVGLNLYCDGSGGDRGFRQIDEGQYDQASEVFGACGASVLLRRELLEDVGLFDERFFMYYEDLDLAWRARLRGWSFRYTPSSKVFHVHCGSSGEWSPFFVFYVERNRVLANLKNAPIRQAFRVLASFGYRALRKWIYVLTLRERGKGNRGQAIAFLKASFSLFWEIPGMIVKRFSLRRIRRTVPDQAFAYLIELNP